MLQFDEFNYKAVIDVNDADAWEGVHISELHTY